MAVYRQFSDAQGVSHLEKIDLADHPELLQFQNAQKFKINNYAPGTFLDWHPAPQHCAIVILSGILEIGVSDGTKLQCHPGDLRFTSDEGKGHTGRVIGDEPCISMMMYHDNEI